MKQNYFTVNNKEYYTGTVFLVRHTSGVVKASFMYYDTEYKKFVYKANDCVWCVGNDEFQLRFLSVTDGVDDSVSIPTREKMKDSEIDGLFIGWIWYIFLMTISVIFNDRIVLWIIISVVFFSWRSKKIKEEGMYIEW